MMYQASVRADQLLERFYKASEQDADHALEALLTRLRPHVRRFLLGRAGRKDRYGEQQAEDLCGLTLLRLTEALRCSRESGGERIQDAAAYAVTIADHAWRHAAQGRQAWALLKRQAL